MYLLLFSQAPAAHLEKQERRIIIVSTVRSNTDFVSSDITRSLGFVANSRRMNGVYLLNL